MNTKIKFLVGMAWMFSTSIAMAQTEVSSIVEGTPYLNEKYVNAEIHFEKGSPAIKPLRYNAYQGFMEYQQNGNTVALDPGIVKKIKMNDQIFMVDHYELKGKKTKGFFILLDSGNATLLVRPTITFINAKPNGNLDGSTQAAHYTKGADVYYYKIGNNELIKIGNMKELIASFPDNQDELKSFARQEKISAKKETDLVQFMKYYNSLHTITPGDLSLK